MYKLNLEKGVKANIWLNENLVECRCNDSKIIMEDQTNLFAKSRKIIFVSEEFKKAVEKNKLTGFKFELVWDSEQSA